MQVSLIAGVRGRIKTWLRTSAAALLALAAFVRAAQAQSAQRGVVIARTYCVNAIRSTR